MTIVERFRNFWRGLERFEQALDYDPVEDMSIRMTRLERSLAALQATRGDPLPTASASLTRSNRRAGTSD